MPEATPRLDGSVAIMAPLEQELGAIVEGFDKVNFRYAAGRDFYLGDYQGRDVIAVIAGIGKTAAATTATILVERFRANNIILTGSAAAVATARNIGDIVIATGLTHHDFDLSPLPAFSNLPPHTVPHLGVAELETTEYWRQKATMASEHFLATTGRNNDAVEGLILSGDQFITPDAIARLRKQFPYAQAVEMEGAAVAQVCTELGIPFGVVRSISDTGHLGDFEAFLETQCGSYAQGIIFKLLEEAA